MKERSSKQRQRQDPEFRQNGKYAKVNPCQLCGKSAGIDYCGHPMTDCGDWHDHAICLCRKCYDLTVDLTDVKDFLKLVQDRQSK